MKLTTAHSEVFGSLADDIEKNDTAWKKVRTIIEVHILYVIFLHLVV